MLDLLTRLVNIVERRVALEVSFEDAVLAKIFRSGRELQKRHGVVRAKKIQLRLKQLGEAKSLADMRHLSGRCHELTADLVGHLSLDLDGPYRLLFRPAEAVPPGPGGGLDWTTVSAVIVVGVVDTHN
jgi:plasmid maintenance system killer protein